MPKRTTAYHDTLLEDLKDPTEAAHYLTAAMNDSEDMFLVALRNVAEAHQMSKVAGKAGVSRESLYRMLTRSGNPTYRNLFGILRALDVVFGDVRAKASSRSQPASEHHRRSSRRRRIRVSPLSYEPMTILEDINARISCIGTGPLALQHTQGIGKQEAYNPPPAVFPPVAA